MILILFFAYLLLEEAPLADESQKTDDLIESKNEQLWKNFPPIVKDPVVEEAVTEM